MRGNQFPKHKIKMYNKQGCTNIRNINLTRKLVIMDISRLEILIGLGKPKAVVKLLA
jgi:hypothetical protein